MAVASVDIAAKHLHLTLCQMDKTINDSQQRCFA